MSCENSEFLTIVVRALSCSPSHSELTFLYPVTLISCCHGTTDCYTVIRPWFCFVGFWVMMLSLFVLKNWTDGKWTPESNDGAIIYTLDGTGYGTWVPLLSGRRMTRTGSHCRNYGTRNCPAEHFLVEQKAYKVQENEAIIWEADLDGQVHVCPSPAGMRRFTGSSGGKVCPRPDHRKWLRVGCFCLKRPANMYTKCGSVDWRCFEGKRKSLKEALKPMLFDGQLAPLTCTLSVGA